MAENAEPETKTTTKATGKTARVERIGVVLCDCATSLSRQIDFEHLKKVAAGEPNVAWVQQVRALCGKEGAVLAERMGQQAPQAIVVAGCSEEFLKPGVERLLAQAKLPPGMLAVANLKEQCRGLSGALATAKAAAIMRQAVSRARLLRAPEEQAVEMTAAVMVIGGGWSGLKAAHELLQAGYKVAVVERGQDVGNQARSNMLAPEEQAELNSLLTAVRASEAHVLNDCDVVGCRGVAGAFDVRLSQQGQAQGQAIEGRVGAIIVAPSLDLVAPFAAYGLKAGERVISAAQLEEVLASPKAKAALAGRGRLKVAFLVGLAGGEAPPAAMERALRDALAIVRSAQAAKVFIFAKDMRVASQGLEALSLEARQAGVIVFKFSTCGPRVEQQDGSVKLTFEDEILTEPLELTPDLLVVGEEWRPSAWLPELVETLRLAPDPQGFAQPDNVHFFPVESNREGIFVAGPARKPLGLRASWSEAEVAVSRVKALLSQAEPRRLVRATIDRGKCTICLTCVRFCPHGAIGWDNRAVIMPAACQGCGICAAECPMEAIQLTDVSDAQVEAEIGAWEAGTQLLAPRLVSFCCQRSAYQAMGMAVELGHVLPAGLQAVRVPCAGKVDVDYILKAFETGADGVMVLGCHEDNCRSLRGNTYASWRVEAAQRMLADVGLEPERVAFANLASNMGAEFARLVTGMEARLVALGSGKPAGIKVSEADVRRAAGQA